MTHDLDLDVASVTFPALGTTATLAVTSPATLPAARAELDDVLAEVDVACSRFRDDSELMKVNRAGGRPVAVSERLLAALEVALRAAQLTDGDVDPTVGTAVRMLGYDRDFGTVAKTGESLTCVVQRVPGWRQVRVDHRRGTIEVPAGVELDLGATAKAFAADQGATRAAAAVGDGVLVSLGGDVAVAGPAPKLGWPVLVTDDHAAGPDAPGETVAIATGGLATSSTTVRRWRRGDEVVHHIVDPAVGRSAATCWRTVTVAAASCVDANIASTASIIRGEAAPRWLAERGLSARLVRGDGEVVRVGDWPASEQP